MVIRSTIVKVFLTIFFSCVVWHNANADVGGFYVVDDYVVDAVLQSENISEQDLQIYQQMFESIEKQRFYKLEKLEKKLQNKILWGNVLAEQYLSKTYPSKFVQLKKWLEKYADLPYAQRIYKLAKKKSKGKQKLVNPANLIKRKQYAQNYGYDTVGLSLTGKYNAKTLKKISQFKRYINRGKSKSAKDVLTDKNLKKFLNKKDFDTMSAQLSVLYYMDKMYDLALEWAKPAADRSQTAMAMWICGISYYRKDDFENAANYFSALAALDNNDNWLISAGGYWAFRVYKKLGMQDEALSWLKIAANYQRTFYGILANYQLGETPDYNWGVFSYLNDFSQYDYLKDILKSKALKRAVLLIKIGRMEMAQKELANEIKYLTNQQREIVMFISSQFNMYNLSLKIAKMLEDKHHNLFYDCVTYPDVSWQPKSGWQCNKNFVMGVVRQESLFNPEAKSNRGARGLMQILPLTAIHVSKNIKIKKDKSILSNPEYNLDVGQKYINYLLEKPYIDGNLFYMMTSYNAGPDNFLKWKKKVQTQDPLLFIESIPSRETRIYLERVMANFWIYSYRKGIVPESIKQLANDEWPTI